MFLFIHYLFDNSMPIFHLIDTKGAKKQTIITKMDDQILKMNLVIGRIVV